MKKLLTAAVLAFAATTPFAASTTLSGTVRDFNADGVNFEGSISGLVTGMVETTLTGGVPTLTAVGQSIVNEANFNQWYTKSSDSMPFALTLSEDSPGSGIYSYSSSAFFPIDDMLLGNEGRVHNYHFTYAIAAQFGYKPGTGQTFSFTGDDDVWVFFDNKLGIDLGGVHGAVSATADLDTLMAGKAEGNYSFNFFFAERHTTESNLQITTSLALAPVPEPSTWALMAAGLAAVGFCARRRQRPA